jgi:sensor histidine kinase YesM
MVWHLKVLAGAVLISLLFSLALRRELFHEGLLNMFMLTFIQLEIFLWLGTWFFQSVKPDDKGFIQKNLIRLVLFYICVLVIAFVLLMAMFFYHYLRNNGDFSHFFSDLFLETKSFFTATLIGFAIGALSFFYSQWADAIKRMQKLREEKLIFQYETLKSQVNPHFLFNSLNTLSSLVSKDVTLSEKFIHKLSSVYRYVIENQDKELVGVEEEISFVKAYFYLQKIRDGEKIHLKLEIKEEGKEMIIPVSIQMLVENAIKHNAATRHEPLEITIHYEGMDKLVVRNRLQQKTQLSTSSNIGLKNLNERCRLIVGREIEIQETAEEFVVKVPIKMG